MPLIGTTIFIIFILILTLFRNNIYNIIKPPATELEKLAECKSNLEIQAQACQEFCKSKGGAYPENLQELVSTGFLEKLPTCPSSGLPYIYKLTDEGDFLIECGGLNSHIKTDLVKKGNFPAYRSKSGLILSNPEKIALKEEVKEKEIKTPLPSPTPETIIPVRSGLNITLECYEKDNEISENYECVVRVENVKPDKIHYKWWENYPAGRVQSGDWIMTDLASSRNYNSWWHHGEYKYTEDTAPWISKIVYRELKEKGNSVLNIDVDGRGDKNLKLYLEEQSEYNILLNNKNKTLKALAAHTNKGDNLIILDDPENPLVLLANVSNIYEWHVTKIESY